MPRDQKRQQESFEQMYARLEETVGKLEQGGLPLDDAISLYEQGMALARACQERLDEAEQRITKLRESFAPLEANGEPAGDDDDDGYEYVSEDEFEEEPEEFP